MSKQIEDLVVGDKVFSVIEGWGVITEIKPGRDYPIRVKLDNGHLRQFTSEGRMLSEDKFPTIYAHEIKLDIFKREQPRLSPKGGDEVFSIKLGNDIVIDDDWKGKYHYQVKFENGIVEIYDTNGRALVTDDQTHFTFEEQNLKQPQTISLNCVDNLMRKREQYIESINKDLINLTSCRPLREMDYKINIHNTYNTFPQEEHGDIDTVAASYCIDNGFVFDKESRSVDIVSKSILRHFVNRVSSPNIEIRTIINKSITPHIRQAVLAGETKVELYLNHDIETAIDISNALIKEGFICTPRRGVTIDSIITISWK